MKRFVHRHKYAKYRPSIAVQGFHKSVREVLTHFFQTGELLIEPSSSNSFDNTDPNVSVRDFDLNSVIKDTSLVEAALLAHNTRVSNQNNKDTDSPAEPTPVTE